MSERLPIFVDPLRLADTGRRLAGSLPLAELPRLAPSLAKREGEVAVSLVFGVDEQGVRFVQGRLQAVLELPCQRCLQSVSVPVDREFTLGIVASEAEAERLPGYEPLIVTERTVALADMVEDELILALPMIPLHEPGTCKAEYDGPQRPEAEGQPRKSPFAVLADLKKPKQE